MSFLPAESLGESWAQTAAVSEHNSLFSHLEGRRTCEGEEDGTNVHTSPLSLCVPFPARFHPS